MTPAPAPTTPADAPVLTVPEALAYLRIKRDLFYRLVGDQKLRVAKLGARTVVLRSELDRVLLAGMDQPGPQRPRRAPKAAGI